MRKLCLLLFACLVPATAEVVDSSDHGFTVKLSATMHGNPEAAYHQFVDVAVWWSKDHTFSKDAANLSIDARPQGCFCERLPDGGGVRHLEVLSVAPEKYIVMSGGLGPMQSLAINGTMMVEFSKAGEDAKVTLTYSVFGYVPKGMGQWAAPVNTMLSEQLTNLKKVMDARQ